jgi:hypothetical protein
MRGNVHREKVIDKHDIIGTMYEHSDVKTIHVLFVEIDVSTMSITCFAR